MILEVRMCASLKSVDDQVRVSVMNGFTVLANWGIQNSKLVHNTNPNLLIYGF